MIRLSTCIVALAVISAGASHAAGLAPLLKEGVTGSDAKGFHVDVFNPYTRPMTYDLVTYEADMKTPTDAGTVFPHRVRIGAKDSRRVIVRVDIPKQAKEKTIVVCASTPDLKSNVKPRVCGTYTGRRASRR